MVNAVYKSETCKTFAAGEYPVLHEVPKWFNLPKGYQLILYEHENFKGRAAILSAHDGDASFLVEETACKNPRSMRVVSNVAVVPGPQRDALALEDALHVTGWLQDAMSLSNKRVDWMVNDKFGCFVHWGIYAIAAGVWEGKTVGYAEHLQRAMKLPLAAYKAHFIDRFNPVNFDAEEWIKLVTDAGMKYFVITAKHHDGFAMNHSDVYPYDIRMTPFKRDPIAELKDACDKFNIPFGLYYSHAFDWEHPDAPGNDWEYSNGGGDLGLFEGEKGLWFDQHPELVPRTAKYYVDTKCIPQILELLQKYKPAILWFDTPHKLPLSENLRILRAIREADPNVIVNGRLARNQAFLTMGDYANTGDRAAEVFPTPGVWETIPTTNESYGYARADKSHKPPEHFIELLIKTASRGGNVLMNLGPTELGAIDDVDKRILKEIGHWLKLNGESIYGTSRSPLPVQTFGETTVKGNTLFLHLLKPQAGSVTLAGLISPIAKAWVLTDKAQKPLSTKKLNYYDTEIALPEALPGFTVIAVLFEGALYHGGDRLISINHPEYLRVFDASHIPSALSRGDGKRHRDFVYGFENTEQPIIWKVRVNKKTGYKLSVHYSLSDKGCASEYSIAVGDFKHVRAVSPKCPVGSAWSANAPFAEDFYVEIDGAQDIVFRPEAINNGFVRLHGISLEPKDSALQETVYVEADTTDTGDIDN